MLFEALGDRNITILRELTKKHETVFTSTFEKAIAYYEENDAKGECVIVIEGKSREELIKESQEKWLSWTLSEHMDHYMNQGMNKKEAMKAVADDRGVPKRDIYAMLLNEE